MKKNLFSAARGYLLAGTVVTGALSQGFSCSPPQPFGDGQWGYDCYCGYDIVYPICASDEWDAHSTCSTYCQSQRGTFSMGVTGPYSTSLCGGVEGTSYILPPGAVPAKVNSDQSTVAITLLGEMTKVPVLGEMKIAGGCDTGTCTVEIGEMFLQLDKLVLKGPKETEITVDGAAISSNGGLAGVETEGVVQISSERFSLNVEGYVNGKWQVFQLNPSGGEDITGFYSPSSGKFNLAGSFVQNDESLAVDFYLEGEAAH